MMMLREDLDEERRQNYHQIESCSSSLVQISISLTSHISVLSRAVQHPESRRAIRGEQRGEADIIPRMMKSECQIPISCRRIPNAPMKGRRIYPSRMRFCRGEKEKKDNDNNNNIQVIPEE